MQTPKMQGAGNHIYQNEKIHSARSNEKKDMADILSCACLISLSTCSLLYLRIKIKRKFLTNKKRFAE